jgi:hypothetical protein
MLYTSTTQQLIQKYTNLLEFLRVIGNIRVCHTQLQLLESALRSSQLVNHVALERPAGHLPAAAAATVPASPQLLLHYWHGNLQLLLPHLACCAVLHAAAAAAGVQAERTHAADADGAG